MFDEILHTHCRLRITCPAPLVIPVLAAPVALIGSGVQATVDGRALCVEGDELPPSLRGPLAYIAPPFVTPGSGVLALQLTPLHWSDTARVGGRRCLRRGPGFAARFMVRQPATQPGPAGPLPDPVPLHVLSGSFLPACDDFAWPRRAC